MMRILNIPAEKYPTRHSFLEEAYSKEDHLFKTVFLMRTKEKCINRRPLWNNAKVYLMVDSSQLGTYKGFVNYGIDIRYLFWIPKIIKNEKINIIQVRDMTFPLLVSLLLRKIFNIKVVYQKSHPHEIQATKIESLKGHKFPLIKYYKNIIDKYLLHNILLKSCDAIFAITSYMKQKLVDEYHLEKDKIYPVPIGVNNEIVKNVKKGIGQKKEIRLIYIGTLVRARRLETIIYALNKVLENEKEKNITLTIAGGTLSENQILNDVAIQTGLIKCVRFLGYVDRYEIYRIISKSDIGISYIPDSDRFSDSCPIKLLEYLASGIPVIGTRNVKLQSEIIKHTEAGILCDDNLIEISNGILKMIHNLEQYKEKAESARDYIIRNYGYDFIKWNISSIYENMMTGNSK